MQPAYFVTSLLVTAGLGLVVWWPVRRDRSELAVSEGFLIVALFWTVLGMIGGLPFMLGLHLNLTDSVFEAVSGFTTTGATVIVGLDRLPASILYHSQQIQWLGGMGIIVLAVAILPLLGVGGMQRYRAETSGVAKDEKLTPRITQTARTLWMMYLGLTLSCAIAYWAAGMTWFDAIGHSFTTVATGGFSTHDASIGHYDSVLIEKRRERAVALAQSLHNTIVLFGDATDEGLLKDEDIERTDVFCALTDDEEANIVSAMLAKRLGARKVVALINRPSYVDLVESTMIDIAVSPQQITIGALLMHVRRGDIVGVHSLRRGAAEAIEAVAHGDEKTSRVVGRRIDELPLPTGAMVGAIVREEQVIVAHGETRIESGDHVVLFLSKKRSIPAVERLFQVNVTFL